MKRFALYIFLILTISYLTPRALAKILHTDYPLAAITSSSMWPTLKEGDLVLIKGISDKTDIDERDIVVYRNDKGFTIHRVVKIQNDQFTTKGDANSQEDAPVKIDAIIGKTIIVKGKPFRIPYLGRVSMRINR